MKKIKWLSPGMGIKRWIFILSVGVLLFSLAVSETFLVFRNKVFVPIFSGKWGTTNTVLGLCGIILIVLGIKKLIQSILHTFIPDKRIDWLSTIYYKRQLKRGPRIVAIGGGTGLPVLLRGLKEYTNNTTAIVTVADDSGSSGRLRREFKVPAPGDIRNCLVALADAEPLLEELFQYRFSNGARLKGHNFGNLFITALSQVTGDFEKAIRESSKILAIRGQVVPSTLSNVSLEARFEDGKLVKGESRISDFRPNKGRIRRVFLNPPNSQPTQEALTAIKEADAIILGPGSLYTSVIPNLLVKGMLEAILATSAIKIYVCNVMTQPGETDGYTAADHMEAIFLHTTPGVFDYVIANTEKVPRYLLRKYQEEGAYPVVIDEERLVEMGLKVIKEKLISNTNYVRHDSANLSRTIMKLLVDQKIV